MDEFYANGRGRVVILHFLIAALSLYITFLGWCLMAGAVRGVWVLVRELWERLF
jgi:hypothetical protein